MCALILLSITTTFGWDRPALAREAFTKFGLLVKNKSSIRSSLVGPRWICLKPKSWLRPNTLSLIYLLEELGSNQCHRRGNRCLVYRLCSGCSWNNLLDIMFKLLQIDDVTATWSMEHPEIPLLTDARAVFGLYVLDLNFGHLIARFKFRHDPSFYPCGSSCLVLANSSLLFNGQKLEISLGIINVCFRWYNNIWDGIIKGIGQPVTCSLTNH